MNRRSLIVVLIGMITGVSGFATVALLRQSRCKGMGGQWTAQAGHCTLPDGATAHVSNATDILAGAVVGVLLGFMLFRMFLYATGRVSRPLQP
jgi:hypothetical protein